jgi:3-oxoacyl-[acyl-carrier protein] reductase
MMPSVNDRESAMGIGKVALVTGSGTGVGAATALALARRGYDVLVNYSRSEADARASEAACREAGADTILLRGDVSNDADCRAMAHAAVERWGRIDALVNNAGISVFGEASRWEALDEAAFQRIFGVNAIGTFQMVRACVPHLKTTGGSIVNVSSIAGSLGIGSSVPYIASKGAVNAMTLYLARELAPHVRVNAVCPGLVTSRWFVDGIGQAGYEKLKGAYESSAPLRRPSTPQDVAEAIVWLVDGARTVTGELVLLDSGMHLGARAVSVPVKPPEPAKP